ncbi:OLC1v1013901C1 [Oldenlandia corymbosa var. corymbosa]|uniref:OLC1v1013901C1 n=1 Tax=Oldenlandia corymbosa var. corymbosa TaxID=529605 RepID=A0AAV1E2V9_OLDCO|nr:OLC1v1013901C1 [Oldenlandia corymbosa var. corymbosa]
MNLSSPFLSLPRFPSAKRFKPSIIRSSGNSTNYDVKEEKMDVEEIRVCTNRTCRRQGSLEILQILSGLSPSGVSVNSCGCLGRCGSGPNVVVLPQALFVGHCGTPSKAARLMISLVFGGDSSDEVERKSRECLEALALRKRAEDEIDKGNFDEALVLLSQAINLKPIGGVHIMYKSRSTARLAVGNISGALEDAREALALAPKYAEAYLCQGDVLMAMDQIDSAEKSYAMALDFEPSLRRSKSFKARIAMLQEKLTPADPS